MNITVQEAREDDLDAVVAVHMRAFPGFFLTTLGHGFLFELYRNFLTIADGRLLVAKRDGRIAGFVAGTLAPDRFFRTLLFARWFHFGCAAMGAVVQRPHAVVPRLLAALQYRGERPSDLTAAGLLSAIAVEPHLSGLGIGAMLVTAYCEEASKEGLEFVYLTTDRDRNEPANRFYQRHGFEVESQLRRRNGRVMTRYVRPLSHRPNPSVSG